MHSNDEDFELKISRINEKKSIEHSKFASMENIKVKLIEDIQKNKYLKKNIIKEKIHTLFCEDKKISYTKEDKKFIKDLFAHDYDLILIYRNKFWLISSGAKKQMFNNPSYYNNLINDYPDYIPSPYEVQIDCDLRRTFPTDPFFRQENNIIKLKNILTAFTRRNVSIGYCQGFNFIVAKLLKRFKNEEETFWIFTQILEELLPINFFTSFTGATIDLSIITKLIKKFLPSFGSKIEKMNGDEICIRNELTKSLIALFTQMEDDETFETIWDCLFLRGSIAFVFASIALFKEISEDTNVINAIESELQSSDPVVELVGAEIQKILYKYKNARNMKYYLFQYDFEFDEDNIECWRNIERNIGKDKGGVKEKNKNKNKNISYKKKNHFIHKEECDLDWPICLYDNGYRINEMEFMVYRTLGNFDVIPDFVDFNFYKNKMNIITEKPFKNNLLFFFNCITQEYINNLNNGSNKTSTKDELIENEKVINELNEICRKIDIFDNIVIERNSHICGSEKSTKKLILEDEIAFKDKKLLMEKNALKAKNITLKMDQLLKEEITSKNNKNLEEKQDDNNTSSELNSKKLNNSNDGNS